MQPVSTRNMLSGSVVPTVDCRLTLRTGAVGCIRHTRVSALATCSSSRAGGRSYPVKEWEQTAP